MNHYHRGENNGRKLASTQYKKFTHQGYTKQTSTSERLEKLLLSIGRTPAIPVSILDTSVIKRVICGCYCRHDPSFHQEGNNSARNTLLLKRCHYEHRNICLLVRKSVRRMNDEKNKNNKEKGEWTMRRIPNGDWFLVAFIHSCLAGVQSSNCSNLIQWVTKSKPRITSPFR